MRIDIITFVMLMLLLMSYPTKITVCLVNSGPNGEDMTTEIYRDEKEKYFERYPGSYEGKCRKE